MEEIYKRRQAGNIKRQEIQVVLKINFALFLEAKDFSQIGFSAEKIVHFGIDQPVVPEYHVLYVLKKI